MFILSGIIFIIQTVSDCSELYLVMLLINNIIPTNYPVISMGYLIDG
jgi:hypothetical protein